MATYMEVDQEKAPFVLPALPFAKEALAPIISAETLDFHYGKHHQTYVTKLNGLAEKDESLNGQSLVNLIKTKSGGIFNNAAQIWNHSFYWNCLKPNPTGADNPATGAVADQINSDFGSYDKFKEEFTNKCVNHFGSGWVWLLQNKSDKKLKISDTHDAGCPVVDDAEWKPVMTCDVWEHAYYIDYRNARPKYMEAYWKLVNWDYVNSQMVQA